VEEWLMSKSETSVIPSNGPGAEACPQFVPTHDEVCELAAYWYKVQLDLAMDFYFLVGVGGVGIRRDHYASLRLARIEEVIGEEALKRTTDAVEQAARRRIGDRAWQALCSNDEAYQKEYEDALSRMEKDKETTERAFAHLQANPSGYHIDDAGDLWSLVEDMEPDKCKHLVLRVTYLKGGWDTVRVYKVDLPQDWRPPFGLGRHGC
jgi:hypothetical protein